MDLVYFLGINSKRHWKINLQDLIVSCRELRSQIEKKMLFKCYFY